MIESAKFTNIAGDSLEFNTYNIPFHRFHMEVEYRRTRRARVQQHGNWRSRTYLGERLFHAEGDILDVSSADYMIRRRAMAKVLTPHVRRKDPMVGTIEILYTGYGEAMQAECAVDGLELPMEALSPSRGEYMVIWAAPDPRLYGVNVQQGTTGTPGLTGGRTYPKVYPRSYASYGTNLFTNPGAEAALAEYAGYNGTIAQSAAQFHGGANSILATRTSGAEYGVRRLTQTGLSALTTYTIGVWVRAAGNFQFALDQFDPAFVSTGAQIRSTATAGSATGWTYVTHTFTTYPGTDRMIPYIIHLQNNGTFYADDFSLRASGPIGGDLRLTNDGEIETFPTVTAYGPFTGPEWHLFNIDGDVETVGMPDLEVAAGDSVTVDFQKRTAFMANGDDVYSYVEGRNWWALEPGPNDVRFAAFSADPGSYSRFTWRNAYML